MDIGRQLEEIEVSAPRRERVRDVEPVEARRRATPTAEHPDGLPDLVA